MTADLSMALAELAEKGADTDALRQVLGFVAQRLMEFGHYSAQLGVLAPLIDWTSQMPGSGRAGSTTSKTC